jgi:hypothetical protein
MNKSFDIRITGEFEDICGTWMLRADGCGKVAQESVTIDPYGWSLNDTIHHLISKVMVSGHQSAVEVSQ